MFNSVYSPSCAEVVLCDLDGTLVDTDMANFSGYREAVASVLGRWLLPVSGRFCSVRLLEVFPDLHCQQLADISQVKTARCSDHMHQSRMNTRVKHWLEATHARKVLVTRSKRERALATLQHHDVLKLFTEVVCIEDMPEVQTQGKFACAIDLLELNPGRVTCLENERRDVELACKHGISRIMTPDLLHWGSTAVMH